MEMTMCRTRNQVTQWEVMSMTHKNGFSNGISFIFALTEKTNGVRRRGRFLFI